MNAEHRERFDALLEAVLDELPQGLRALIDELPIIAEDVPTPELVAALIRDGVLEPGATGEDLCGLHTGIGLPDRSIEDPEGWGDPAGEGAGPAHIQLFREGIVALAGGWDEPDADEIISEEVRITILHELGHHFGLDEDDLDRLGYA